MKRVLVTGGTGFIGRHLVPELARSGAQLTLLTRPQSLPAVRALCLLCEKEPDVVSAELDDWSKIALLMKDFDVCYHLAWIATPGEYLESEQNAKFIFATEKMGRNLFVSGLKHFVALGTCIEYAPWQSDLCRESHTMISPLSTYGKAKARTREIIASAADCYNADYTWVRLFYPYGIGEYPSKLATCFAKRFLAGKSVELNTPDSVKDFIEIRDITSALCLLLKVLPQQELNLGSGSGISVFQFATKIASLCGVDSQMVRVKTKHSYDPYQFHVADTSRLKSLGWRETIELEMGLGDLVSHLKLR